MFVDQLGNFIEGWLFVLWIDGNVEIWDVVLFDYVVQVVVVGDYVGNFVVQFVVVLVVQQIGQVMGFFVGYQYYVFFYFGIGDLLFYGEFVGDWGESLVEVIQVEWQRVGMDFVVYEELVVIVVGMMVGFGDLVIVGGQEVIYFGNDFDFVGIGDYQLKSVYGYILEIL